MEAWEEAGLEGRIHSKPLGKYRYRKTGRIWEVDLYLMEVTRIRANWPEEHVRKRRWVDPRMIDQWATHPGVRKALFSVFGWSKAHEAG